MERRRFITLVLAAAPMVLAACNSRGSSPSNSAVEYIPSTPLSIPVELAISAQEAQNGGKMSILHGSSAWSLIAQQEYNALGPSYSPYAQVSTGIYSFKRTSQFNLPIFGRNHVVATLRSSGKGGTDDLWVAAQNPRTPLGSHWENSAQYANKIASVRAFSPEAAQKRLAELYGVKRQLLEVVKGSVYHPAEVEEALAKVDYEIQFNQARLNLVDALKKGKRGYTLEAINTPVIIEWHAGSETVSLTNKQLTTSAVVKEGYLPFKAVRTVYINEKADPNLISQIERSLQLFGSDARVIKVDSLAKGNSVHFVTPYSQLMKMGQRAVTVVDDYLPLIGGATILLTPEAAYAYDFFSTMAEYDEAAVNGQTNMTAKEYYTLMNDLAPILRETGFNFVGTLPGENGKTPSDIIWHGQSLPLHEKVTIPLRVENDADILRKLGSANVLGIKNTTYQANKIDGSQTIELATMEYVGERNGIPIIKVNLPNGYSQEIALTLPLNNGDLGPHVAFCRPVEGRPDLQATVIFLLRYSYKNSQTIDFNVAPIMVEAPTCPPN